MDKQVMNRLIIVDLVVMDLTSARHDVLEHSYAKKYPETFEPSLKEEVVYIGKNKMTDTLAIPGFGAISIGKLLLSPTRTYAPLVKAILDPSISMQSKE